MDEERQRRDVEREPLGLAGPVEERPREPAELRGRLLRLLERARVEDLLDERLAALARRVLPVPVERGRERRVVAVGLRRLALPELRLRPDLGPQQRLLLMAVALRPPSLPGFRRHFRPSLASVVLTLEATASRGRRHDQIGPIRSARPAGSGRSRTSAYDGPAVRGSRSNRRSSSHQPRRNPESTRSVKGEHRREDDHDRGGPQGEDGKVGGLPALEPVERAASCEESGR